MTIDDLPEGTIIADGHDRALVGFGYRVYTPIAIYDRDKAIELLQDQGMSWEDAEEWISFNVEGAYVGEGTPIFVRFTAYPQD